MEKEKVSEYEEQLAYLRSKRQEICSFLENGPIGLNLNLSIYFSGLVQFELKKKFTNIAKELTTEQFILDEYKEEMGKLCVDDSRDFILRNSFKNEVRMTVITKFMLNISDKKMYPSEVRRKEKMLNNVIRRANEQIDEYFRYRDIYYHEISPVIDMFEVVVNNKGKHVDLHIGNRGFTLGRERRPKDILSYVEEELLLIEDKEEMAHEFKRNVMSFIKDDLNNESRLPKVKKILVNLLNEYKLSDYEIRNSPIDKFNENLKKWENGIKDFIMFIGKVDESALDYFDELKVSLRENRICNELFSFDYRKGSVEEFVNSYKELSMYRGFITTIKEDLMKNEVRADIVYKEGYMEVSAKTRVKRLLTTFSDDATVSRKDVFSNLIYNCKEGKIYRQTGEEILTTEVIVFETMERLRNLDSMYIQSVEKAKEMFYSTLTLEEEKTLKEKGLTILEGEGNYYALISSQVYNNVIKIPKVMKDVKEIKALCIHPEDASVPMYDGFAAISFALKTGDEQYVLNNSNEFLVAPKVLTKVMDVFNSFVPQQGALA